ncbi:hypothetical protein HMPREF9370_0972 [Neisseria wadsworthii 9715]|uniref:Uncharacterized protein n=1 Tax=Neisseria wadsworthii 9715 TaxID=1030841 RepID=G4CPH2_9NEIS|nr:hypothetical protein HMPREF9370_0972 [Neisseria wadsworthii 9715]
MKHPPYSKGRLKDDFQTAFLSLPTFITLKENDYVQYTNQ